MFQHHRRISLAAIGAVGGLAFASPGSAATLTLREGAGDGITDTIVDDTFIGSRSQDDNNNGDDTSLDVSTLSNGDVIAEAVLIAFTDLFDYLPSESITITSATLRLTGINSGDARDTTYVYRMTTDWLVGDAGTNETNVTWNHADVAGSGLWASNALRTADGVGGFTPADYTTDGAASFVPLGWGAAQLIDVTEIVRDMVDFNENFGFAIILPDADVSPTAAFASSENVQGNLGGGPPINHPTLIIEYNAVPEPASLLLLGAGVLVIAGRRRTPRLTGN